MGRPISTKVLGTGAGNQIKIRAKVGSNPEGNGYIVSQRGTDVFNVNVAGNVGECKMVAKASGLLAADEMTVDVLDDTNTVKQASRIDNKFATVDGVRKRWSFNASLSDGYVQVQDANATNFYVITIGTQPTNQAVTAPATATFTVAATSAPTTTLSYQWQRSDNGGSTWTNVGTNSNSYTTGATTIVDDNNDQYRVIVSATGATPVTSNAVTLTVS